MAIKTISKLDDFDNGIATGSGITGGALRYWVQTTPKKKDGSQRVALDDTRQPEFQRESGAPVDGLNENPSTFYETLFEISQPLETGSKTHQAYYSKQLTYRDLIKNISFDVKQYLNEKNGLYDTNLEEIKWEKTHLKGLKIFGEPGTDSTFGMQVLNSLSAPSLVADDLNFKVGKDWVYQTGQMTVGSILTANNSLAGVQVNSLVQFSAANLTANSSQVKVNTKFIAPNLSAFSQNEGVGVGVYISEGLTVQNKVDSPYFTGGAYCLKNNDGTHTLVNVGSVNQNKVGNPVCFVSGRPSEITCVNYATNAYNLIDERGAKYNVGTGELRTSPYAKTKSAVYFSDGKPCETNVIDYALHAYWSDLGEKYLGDEQYEPGTLVQFGGEKEITIAKSKANAIVSTNAFDLNHDLKDGIVIALCGRVPTKIVGKIKKFDKVVLSNIPGVGRAKKWYEIWKKTIGLSLEENLEDSIKLVECVTRFSIDA